MDAGLLLSCLMRRIAVSVVGLGWVGGLAGDLLGLRIHQRNYYVKCMGNKG